MKKFHHAIYAAIIALLLLLNLVTVVRILTHKNKSIPENASVVMGANGTHFRMDYFREEMQFDIQQMEALEKANALFKPQTQEVIHKMDLINDEIRQEMQKPNIQLETIKDLEKQSGEAYAELKALTVDFYLQLKSLCRPEQEPALQAVFAALFLASPHCPNRPCLHALNQDAQE